MVHSFEPIANASSRLLILGSMPGKASLRAGQYYAHPRNVFWRIIGELFGIDPGARYELRIARLLACGVALWDVLHSCAREGSLDSEIDPSSIVVNPFAEFLRSHAAIRTVCFNGATAEVSFRRYVLPGLPGGGRRIAYHRLPSTSPANAAIPYPRKLDAWRAACGGTRGDRPVPLAGSDGREAPLSRGSPGRGRRRPGNGRCRAPSAG